MISVTNGSKIQILISNKYFLCRIHYWSSEFSDGPSDCISLFGHWEAML